MTDRIPWNLKLISTDDRVSTIAIGPAGMSANAAAEMTLLPPTDYGVPKDVPWERVFRFSRVVAKPKGKGGGTLVLAAAVAEMDRRGLWGVLEASPYPGQDKAALMAFYEAHGFLHGPLDPIGGERGLMYRPPKEVPGA